MVRPDLDQSSPEVRAALITAAGEVYSRAFASSMKIYERTDQANHDATEAMSGFLDKLEAFSN